MKREIPFCVIGILLGIAILIAGIWIMNNPPSYDSTVSTKTAIFGADYYTEQFAATKNAADNAAAAAYNIKELGKRLSVFIGLGFIFAGLVVALQNAKRIAACSGTIPVMLADNIISQTPKAASDTANSEQQSNPEFSDELPDL
ncbi:MAG: hypothetical protein Q3989_10380 [Eubacteriales bacterium]|nr:hypothetical protein [Eubacteriales bacterium]